MVYRATTASSTMESMKYLSTSTTERHLRVFKTQRLRCISFFIHECTNFLSFFLSSSHASLAAPFTVSFYPCAYEHARIHFGWHSLCSSRIHFAYYLLSLIKNFLCILHYIKRMASNLSLGKTLTAATHSHTASTARRDTLENTK